MSKFLKIFKSPHVQIALATGISIIVMAYFSKRVLPRPIGYLPTAIPPFFMVVYEALMDRYKNKRICTTWYWVVVIFLSTAIIILAHMF
jgi:predicted histidine transporter YuiF (NhaC family)